MTRDGRESSPSAAARRVGWAQLVGTVALGLAIAYSPLWAPSVVRAFGMSLPGDGPLTALWRNWIAVAVLLGYVAVVERRKLSSLLMTKPRPGDLQWAIYLFGAVMVYSWIIGVIRPQPANSGVETITALPVLGVIALILTAAITEEILFRGYPIERIAMLTGHRWIGAAISLAIFLVPHLVFFTPEWLLYQGPGTLAIYVLYLWRRNLYACMLMHLLINAPILIPTIFG